MWTKKRPLDDTERQTHGAELYNFRRLDTQKSLSVCVCMCVLCLSLWQGFLLILHHILFLFDVSCYSSLLLHTGCILTAFSWNITGQAFFSFFLMVCETFFVVRALEGNLQEHSGN